MTALPLPEHMTKIIARFASERGLSQRQAQVRLLGVMCGLPERLQSDVAYRIATMENITPNVLKEIEESLEASLRDMLGGNQDVGGPKVVADMLNLTGSSVEKNVLDQMDAQDPEVAESVRNLMFVFEDISKLTDREIQTLVREVDQKDLVVALKSASDEMKDKILGNMSERGISKNAAEPRIYAYNPPHTVISITLG